MGVQPAWIGQHPDLAGGDPIWLPAHACLWLIKRDAISRDAEEGHPGGAVTVDLVDEGFGSRAQLGRGQLGG